MLRNYLKIVIRTLIKYKLYSSLNIGGLALGLTASLLIYLWIQQERKVDNFHAHGPHLFMVYERVKTGGQINKADTPQLLADELKRTIPEIQLATGFAWDHHETFQVGSIRHKLNGSRAGTDFFRMFSYPLVQGTIETALKAPNSLAISRKMAELYFGTPQRAMGQLVRFDNRKDLMVTAVFENIPTYSSDQFDYLLNWNAWVAEDPLLQQWGANFVRTYVQLRPDADPGQVDAKIRHFIDAYLKKSSRPSADFTIELALQRFGDRYLYTHFSNGQPSGGRIAYVWVFGGIGLFILLIACINFTNLATALAIKRSKEIGVRKVIGSSRWSLIRQLFGETVLLTSIAVVLALFATWLALPSLSQLTGQPMTLPVKDWTLWLAVFSLIGCTSLVAGSYPALYLSSLEPVQVLKGTYRSPGTASIRRGLVGFQFTLSILFITTTLVVTQQTNYLQTKQTGYNRAGILYIPLEGNLITNYALFRQEAAELPGVSAVDRTSERPHAMESTTHSVNWTGKSPSVSLNFSPASVGYDFVNLLGLKISAGRDFSRAFATDTSSFLINEEAKRQMGLKNPVGVSMSVYGRTGIIIGVLKDFHFNSLHQPIQPLVLSVSETLNFGSILVRTQAGKTKEALAGLEKLYRQFNPNYPFTFSFLDQEYQKQYRSEQVIGTLTMVFSGLAIFIACLGLFGLATFTAEQRTKEIGVRKVLGASITNVVVLLTKDFLKLVFIALIIASPVAWYSMNQWLQGFAYKVTIAWWYFALAGLLVVSIALVTVSFQTIKAALVDPVKSLRAE